MVKRFLAAVLAYLLILAAPLPAHATWYVWDAGAWRAVTAPYVWDAGAWRQVQNAWVWDAGAWRQFYAGFTPVTHTYTSGSGTETVPSGAHTLTLYVEGGGGGPGGSYVDFGGDQYASGGGGGAGGAAVSVFSVSPSDWGAGLTWAVPGSNNNAHGLNSYGTPNLVGNQGSFGGSACGAGCPGSGGSGGGASGGNSANLSGGAGSSGNASMSSGIPGGAGGSSNYGYGNGAQGCDAPGGCGSAGGGVVIYQWT